MFGSAQLTLNILYLLIHNTSGPRTIIRCAIYASVPVRVHVMMVLGPRHVVYE
jgi:hypothetical protein